MKIGDTVIVKPNILEARRLYSWYGSEDILNKLIDKSIIIEDIYSGHIIIYDGFYIPKIAVYTLSEYRELKIKNLFNGSW